MSSSNRGGALAITDSLVKLNNMVAGFAWLAEKAAVNDVVIISFSGHGITSKNGKFYFMLYDSDFKNPEETALSFDVIFELLKVLPCRKKLVLLDACESGDFDNDGYVVKQQSAVEQSVKRCSPESCSLSGMDERLFRGFGGRKRSHNYCCHLVLVWA
ncbi:MAG: caspase family protein [Bacteroidetes bacterium]|nr:caspase family protein [Bacteroidota bacterium]